MIAPLHKEPIQLQIEKQFDLVEFYQVAEITAYAKLQTKPVQ